MVPVTVGNRIANQPVFGHQMAKQVFVLIAVLYKEKFEILLILGLTTLVVNLVQIFIMKNKILLCCALLKFTLTFSQTEIKMKGHISSSDKINDTINFICPFMLSNGVYYDVSKLSAKIFENDFETKFHLNYPHMFTWSLNSEKKSGIFNMQPFFIDNTTTEVIFDSAYELKTSNGVTQIEYATKFIPYIFEVQYENLKSFLFDEAKDERFLNYIKKNPESYIALWILIRRINFEGYSGFFEKCAYSFSNKMKSEKLWNILNDELQRIKIHDKKKFPEFLLKNVDLNSEKMTIPKGKYILIDFWFSRCRPCLEQVPMLKSIYNKYNSKGFTIIGISTDKTENIELWKKRIVEKDISWKNYLDENAVIATQQKIFTFPTNFLLDKDGKVIRKNISSEELEKILEQNLL